MTTKRKKNPAKANVASAGFLFIDIKILILLIYSLPNSPVLSYTVPELHYTPSVSVYG